MMEMNNDLRQRIDALSFLGNYLANLDIPNLQEMIDYAYIKNKWFTKTNTIFALQKIRNQFLDKEKLVDWINKYQLRENQPKRVGLILAGNIPAVGFHDLLCTFICGQKALIKYSDKDDVIIPHLIEVLVDKYPIYKDYFIRVEKLKDFDAVIATGSDNSARYFHAYFDKYPHIIRKNRNGVAILNGEETNDDLRALGNDIFTYFGLGCRNTSKIFVPRSYHFERLLAILHENNEIVLHDKYKNNFDYNIALYLINKRTYLNNGSIILLEDLSYTSRIASLHFEYYEDRETLKQTLNQNSDKIQCITTNIDLSPLTTFTFNQAQNPSLDDYADGVDTIEFLANLK